MPERQEPSPRISDLFHQALERDAREREVFLDAACGSDHHLRREIESLLRCDSGRPLLLEQQAVSHGPCASDLVGTRAGAYRIEGLLGSGGMGHVYRARDDALARDVAIKVLPPLLANDVERQSRFAREARVLASLNHPHIAAIHGLEDVNGGKALVLELVEGPTIAARLRRGPLSLDQALAVARDVADALAVAHDHHIVHRDLKPSNVVLSGWPAEARHVGGAPRAKVIDFGLARLLDECSEPAAPLELAGSRDTVPGRLLGSPSYMSPEQARGLGVDRRADVWAFGCLLYEMLTGCATFVGETTADTLAQVLEREPDWSRLPANTPDDIRRLLRRCLEKDPERRLRDLGDARLDIEEALDGTRSRVGRRRGTLGWVLTSMCAAAVALVLFVSHRGPAMSPPPVAFTIMSPPNTRALQAMDPYTAISPDGRHIAFAVRGKDLRGQLWVRSLDAFESRILPGTEGAQLPFWSPDSREVAFFSVDGYLKAVRLDGGTVRVICPAASPLGGSWIRNGHIIFSTARSSTYQPRSIDVAGLHRVAPGGGASTPIVLAQVASAEGPRVRRYGAREGWPSFLPDGRHFLYVDRDSKTVRLASLDSGTSQSLLQADSQAIYANPGHLLFVRDGALMGQAFDADRRVLRGDVFRVVENVRVSEYFGGAVFSVSETGILAYSAGVNQGESRLVWFDPRGERLEVAEPATVAGSGLYNESAAAAASRLSPDGTRVLQSRVAPDQADLWVIDLARRSSIRLTSTPADEQSPIWSPDGTQVAYVSDRTGSYSLHRMAATGSGQEVLLYQSGYEQVAEDWSPDGRFIAFTEFRPDTRDDISLLSLAGERTAMQLLATEANELQARFSPDGRWLAYLSNRTGRLEAYLQPLPAGPSVLVSLDGAREPFWSHDGRRLYFTSEDSWLMAADLAFSGSGGMTVRIAGPARLFRLPANCGPRCVDVSVDTAGRFLVVYADAPAELMRVLVNWMRVAGRPH